MDLWTTLAAIPGIGPVLPYLAAAIAVCAALATALPAPSATAPRWYRGLHTAINWVALNLGHARNAAVPGPAAPPSSAAPRSTP